MAIENNVADCNVVHEEIVNLVRKDMPEEPIFFDLADLFSIFGDSTRVRILWALDIHDMCVCDIAILLNLTKSAVSHQLRILRQANLVRPRREGKVVFYTLADEHVRIIFEKGMEHIYE